MKQKKKYNVEIVETLSRVLEIEANSYEDAESIAETQYDTCEVILDYTDKLDTNYKPYPPQKISKSLIITVDFNKEEREVKVASENSSMISYKCETEEDLKSAINTYISNYVECEPVKAIKVKNLKEYER